LLHQRDHANNLALIVLGTEVGGSGGLVIDKADLVGALMRPQHGLAKTDDFVGAATGN
jgi:hypothetical protein